MHTGIIYAAGVNKRLSRFISEPFKGLHQLPSGETLILRQARHLISLNINRLVVVIGLEHQKIADHVTAELGSVDVRIVLNEEYKNKGNMLSLWAARDFCETDVTFTTSDLYYEAPLPKMFGSALRSTVIVETNINKAVDFDDAVKVKVDNGSVSRIHKRLNLHQTDGVCPGFYHYKAKDIKKVLTDINEQLMLGNVNQSLYRSLDRVALDVKLLPVGCGRSFWLDVDTAEDLESLRCHFNGK